MAAYVVAVTGGVASGKSATTRAFESLGITIADADLAARAVVAPGQPALAEIAALFGPDCLLEDGHLDRVAMRARIFQDPAAKASLEALLHPRIRRWLQEACLAAAGPYVVAAIPLLAEAGGRGSYPWLDRILVVDVPESAQLARLVQRDGVDADLAQRMIAGQASRSQRLAIANDVLVNDGTLAEIDDSVGRLHAIYLEAAGRA